MRPRPDRVLLILLAHRPGEDVDAASQSCRALLLRTGRVRSPGAASGRVAVHWGR
ncbi:hypothetical protein HMPREF1550_00336 [Actinomyces sp. oral taxon 877 str. F0543]|nr:hypothetical protein HMPREF1550_00336 [Actinomyces sp. oral taxon 877 str. F0543]